MGSFAMRRLAAIVAACALLASCGDTWLGENGPPPLPGKRISVLAHAKALEPDDGTKEDIILPAPESLPEWPQAGGYPPHAMHHLQLGENLKRVWSADVGAGGNKRRVFLTQPIVADGKVFAMDAEAVLSAYDLANGRRLWRVDLAPKDADNGSFGGGLAYDEGRLFVTTGFAQVIALDPANGHDLWRQPTAAPVRGAPTARAGRVLAITVDNETLALSAEDGHQLWHHNGINELASMVGGTSPAVDGNVVVSPYSSGELYALRIENGTTLWVESFTGLKRTDQVATLTDIRGLPVIDRGKVFAAGNSDTVAAIDLRTGRRVWDKTIGSIHTPWIAGDYVYLITNTPELVCFEAKSGRIRWVTPLQEWRDPEEKTGRIVWTGPVLASDRLIVASSEGEALAVSPYTGALLGREELPDGISIAPIIAADTLIFVTDEGELVAYR